MSCNKFEGITPQQIIEFTNNKMNSDYLNQKPIEILKTKYIVGQKIILKGNKTVFKSLIEFWLSTQIWYGRDGEDYFFEKLVVDQLKNYSSWQNDPNRVGICLKANEAESKKYNEIISQLLNNRIEQDYLIMNPTWNEEKVMFIDNINYYLYFFWTGE